ncbi:hypothetical protein [Bauldia sp.]|uniref:hypothetical protein n=1 Tax=Bauldia sp. TaxID=2575872 RepID=UPI003BAA4282
MFLYTTYENDLSDPKYTQEALLSAYSLRRHTSADITLITNAYEFVAGFQDEDWFPLSHVLPCDIVVQPKELKVRSLSMRAGRNTIYLDTDTIIMGDISRVFAFSNFQFAAVLSPGRANITTMNRAVKAEKARRYQFNSGVMFIRSGFCGKLGRKWARQYQKELEKNGPDALDQPPLHWALRALKPRMLTLPNNYNFRSHTAGFISGACFVYHGHFFNSARALFTNGFSREAADALLARFETINSSLKNRVILPIEPPQDSFEHDIPN